MTKLPAPTDIQQSGVATYTGRHRDLHDQHAEAKEYEPRHSEADAMPSGQTDLAALATMNPAVGIRIDPRAIVAELRAALDAGEERRQAQNGGTR